MKAFGTHTAFRASIFAILFGLLAILAVVTLMDLSSSVAYAQGANCHPSNPQCGSNSGGGGSGNTPPPNTGGGSQNAGGISSINLSGRCQTCFLFNEFEKVGRALTERILIGISEEAQGILTNALWVYMIILLLSTLIGRIDGQEFLKKFMMMAFVFVLADFMIEDGFEFYQTWILDPFMTSGANFAKYIIDTASQSDSRFTHETFKLPPYVSENGAIFGDLMARVEAQIWGFFSITRPIVHNQGGIFGNLGALVIVIVINIAFLFVLGIFIAFMVEALFKFLAMGFLSPLLIVAMAFPITRSITWAALRVNLGAMLTIMLAGGALGMTTAIVANYLDTLAETFEGQIQNGAQACDNVSIIPSSGGEFVDTVLSGLGLNKPCIPRIDVYSAEFLIFFIIAFVSILLHLQSKSIASNLSGANDGVGPAAATVAAAKVGLGVAASAGTGAAGRMLFGGQGASGLVRGGGLGDTVANVSNQGALGLAAQGATNLYHSVGPRQSQPSPSPPPPSGGGPAFSSGAGGGGGGPSSLNTNAGQQQFARMIADAINGPNRRGGRDRSGN